MKILLGHGSGGRLTHELIKELCLKRLSNPILKELADSASLSLANSGFAFTTDSFVVSPLFFKGGDIGKLAVCGTINDLVVCGAQPLYLSLALIIEEGLDYSLLERVIDSISMAARRSKVEIVTGDMKVVERGACDKLFINTAGIGRIVKRLGARFIEAGDKILLTGRIAEHGLSILTERKNLDLSPDIKSDCASLDSLLIPLLKDKAINPAPARRGGIKFMRDPTRGGVATTLNEVAQATGLGIVVEETRVPISSKIKAACELLGIEPLYIANEGKAILVVKPDSAQEVLDNLRKHPQGKFACLIGEVVSQPEGKVLLRTVVGTTQILPMLTSEPLPRIC